MKKRFAFAISLLLHLTISCVPTATPQQQISFMTAAIPLATATLTAKTTGVVTHTPVPPPPATVIAMEAPTGTKAPPTATATATKAATATENPMVKPTETPPPPTATPTEVFAQFVPSDWGSFTSGERAGTVDPQQMYLLAGAVNRANRSILPVGEMEKVRIAVDTTGADLTALNKDAYGKLKSDHLTALRADSRFKALWPQLTAALKGAGLGNDKATVIWDPGAKKVKMVVWQDGDNIRRYSVAESASGLSLQETENFSLLPQLKAEGPYILRTDQVAEGEDRRIQFKGVNMTIVRPSQIDFKANIYFISTRVLIDKAFEWGANLVRFQVDIDIINDGISEFDKIIDYLETKGMYAIIVPFSFGKTSKNSFGAPIPAVTPFMGEMARRYKNHPNVMFELVNELEEQNDYNVVRQGLRDIAAAIFAQNNQAFIWLPGLRYNRRFSEIIANLNDFESPNKGIDAHNYLSLDSNGNNVTEARRDFQQAFGRVPVLIGEAGVQFDRGGQTNPDDDKYVEEAINWTEQYHNMVQIAAYCFDAAGLNSLLTTWGNPSKRGKWYYDDFKRNQHTFLYR